MGSRGSSEWCWGVILVVHEGRLWGTGGHLRGDGGSSCWSMRVIGVVRGVNPVVHGVHCWGGVILFLLFYYVFVKSDNL